MCIAKALYGRYLMEWFSLVGYNKRVVQKGNLL